METAAWLLLRMARDGGYVTKGMVGSGVTRPTGRASCLRSPHSVGEASNQLDTGRSYLCPARIATVWLRPGPAVAFAS